MRNDFYVGIYEDKYLAHHGILGQKWGIRRFQNYDGTLTPEGRQRYGVGERGTVRDISTPDGYNRRIKDLKKGIRINEKKRARSYTKIRDNGGLPMWNRKHARRIDEYTSNIKKGQDEIDYLLSKAEKEGYSVKNGKVNENIEAEYRRAKLRVGADVRNVKYNGLDEATFRRDNAKDLALIRKYGKKFDGRVPSQDELEKEHKAHVKRLINKYSTR